MNRGSPLRGEVSVVVPCRNEAPNIRPLVSGLRERYGGYLREILLVDDCSTDTTRDEIRSLAADDPRVKLIGREPPNGVGRALADGCRAASGRWVLFLDCDFQRQLPELRGLFEAAEAGADVAVGSRFAAGRELRGYPLPKRVANRSFHLLARLLLGRRFRDLTNNLKLMRREAADQLPFVEPGFAVNAETGLQPLVRGFRVREVPVSWTGRTQGMGESSFRLLREGGGYVRALLRAWAAARDAQASRRGPLIALLFVLCAALRLGLLDRHGLWVDEFFCLGMATGPSLEHPAALAEPGLGDFTEAPEALPPRAYSRFLEHDFPPAGPGRVLRAVFLSDTNPPLYYLLLNVWTRVLGAGDRALRLFSLLFSLACVPLLWTLAYRYGGRAAAAGATLLFAASPLCVFYSTEGRMYAMLLFLTLGFMELTLRLQERGFEARRFWLWVLTGAAGLLTHYFFFFVWLAAASGLALRPGRCPRRFVAGGAALTALLVLPWYAHLPESLAQWRVTRGWLEQRPGGYHALLSPLLLPFRFLSTAELWGRSRWWDLLDAGILLPLLVAGAGRRPPRLFWAWLFAPALGVAAFDLLRGTYASAIPRYALAGLPAACILAGLGLARLGARGRGVAVALVLLLSAVGLTRIYRSPDRNGQDYPAVARSVVRRAEAGDLILVHSIPSGAAGIARYIVREAGAASGAGFAPWVTQLGGRRPEGLAALAAGRRRVILVSSHGLGPGPEARLGLRAAGGVPERIHGAVVRVFSLPAP